MELNEGKVQWPFFTNGGDNHEGFRKKKKKGNSFTTNTLNKNAAGAKQPKK
jgi:hypothetical protein